MEKASSVGRLQRESQAFAHVARLRACVEARHARHPGGRAQEGRQDADRGGLAGAVRPEEAEQLAGRDVEADAVHGARLAVDLDEVVDFDDRGVFHSGHHGRVMPVWASGRSIRGPVVGTYGSGYWGVQAMRWTDPPAVADPTSVGQIDGRAHLLFLQRKRLHMIAWKEDGALYWVVNALDDQIPNALMLALPMSCERVDEGSAVRAGS